MKTRVSLKYFGLKSNDPRSFPRRGEYDLLVNVDIEGRNGRGRNRRPNFVIFVVLDALIVSRWVVVVFVFCVPGLIQEWGTQGESKISSFCF